MEMKIVGITVAILVSITVLAGVLMPVLDDATATTDTFTNEGYFYLNKYTTEDSITVDWESSTPNIIKVNDTVFDLSDVSIPVTILASSNGGSRFEYTSNMYCQYINSAGILTADVNNNVGSLVIVCEGGTMTATYTPGEGATLVNPVTRTNTYDEFYCISETGDYVMKKSDKSAYVLDDSTIFALGVTRVGTSAIAMCLSGTIADGVTVTQVNSSPSITFTDPVIDKAVDSDHEELNSLSKITFTADNSGTTANVTYSYFIVPTEVTAERSVHFTDNQNALLAVIPMLVIVALLIGVVALVIRSRLD